MSEDVATRLREVMQLPDLLQITARTASRLYGIPESEIYEAIKTGQLGGRVVSGGRRDCYYTTRRHMDAWVAGMVERETAERRRSATYQAARTGKK